MKYIVYVTIAYTALMIFGFLADHYIGIQGIPFFKYCFHEGLGDPTCDGAHDYNQLRVEK